jgi:PEP-CTERM motif
MTVNDGREGTVCAGPLQGRRPSTFTSSLRALRVTLASALCLGFASTAHAALEAELHEVNTSVGLAPTSASNEWALITDPSMAATTTNPLSIYIPEEGMLDNSFNPNDFQLAVSPYTNTFALGYSVQGVGAFEVTSFAVQMSGGGYYDVVQDPDNPNNSVVSAQGNVSGTETGVVDDIFFELNGSEVNQVLPATEDQNFFQLNLVPVTAPADSPDSFNPGIGTVFADSSSFFTIIPANPDDTTDPTIITNFSDGTINGSSTVPEPGTLGLIALSALGGLAARRRSTFTRDN